MTVHLEEMSIQDKDHLSVHNKSGRIMTTGGLKKRKQISPQLLSSCRLQDAHQFFLQSGPRFARQPCHGEVLTKFVDVQQIVCCHDTTINHARQLSYTYTYSGIAARNVNQHQ